MQILNVKNPRLNEFQNENDPEALAYLNDINTLKKALKDGTLYCRYIDGDRKGSIAKLKPDPQYSQNLEPKIEFCRSFYNNPHYRIQNDSLYMIATWKGRKNKVKESLSFCSEFEFLIGENIETIWVKFDSKAAKEEVLKNPNQKDIDGNLLNIGDSVMFINARYGSRMILERGKVKEFKVVVDSKKTSISTIIENKDGVLSTLTYPEDMVCKL